MLLYTGRDTQHVSQNDKPENIIDYYSSARRPSEQSITVSRKSKIKEDGDNAEGYDLDEIISLATQISFLKCDNPNELVS